jgi:hypothetical protein
MSQDGALTLVSLLACLGCASPIAELSPSKSFDHTDRRTVVVFRVEPPSWVVLEKGHYVDDAWKTNARSDRTQFWRDDGFIVADVARSREDEAYAVTQIRPGRCPEIADAVASPHPVTVWSAVDYDSFFRRQEGGVLPVLESAAIASVAKGVTECPPYQATDAIRLPTFEAVPGQAVYLGTVKVDFPHMAVWQKEPWRSVRVTLLPASEDIEQAARLVADTFPRVLAMVVPGGFRMLRRRD